MIWAQSVLPLILGLVVAFPGHTVQAGRYFNFKNSTHARPGNRTFYAAHNAHYVKLVCQGKRNGLRLPIEESCTQYFECQQGMANLKTCLEGKHFSKQGLTCIDAHLSICKSEQMTKRCDGPCCGKEDGLYPDKADCSNFIVCLGEQADIQSCGGVFQFNEDELICDIPERVRCSQMIERPITDHRIESQLGYKKPIMYMVSHRVCRNKPNGTTIGIFNSCNKFYLCVNGEGYLKSCGNLKFNTGTHFCDNRPRIFCPEMEIDDVIMAEDEYPLIGEIPDPLAPPVVGSEKPLEPNWGLTQELKPTVNKPKPDLSEEDTDYGWHMWETKSTPKPPHVHPGKPLPEYDGPPVVGQEHEPVPMPHLPEEFEHPTETPLRPPNQGPPLVHKPPLIDPTPPIVEETLDPKDFAHLCDDKSIGALVQLPNHCNKYIRCRWDWIERRVAEIVSCPKNKHFNAKAKKCDSPKKAGCEKHLKKPKSVNLLL